MQNRVTSGTLVALACCAALSYAAQQPPSPAPNVRPPGTIAPTPTPQAPNAPSAKPGDKDLTTVVGCVRPGTGLRSFVLASSPRPLVPPTAQAPPATADKGTRYELVAESNVDLQKLVGRQVEASGTVSKSTAPTHDTTAPGRELLDRFDVKSVRETGMAC
jgi:hypothetical protein